MKLHNNKKDEGKRLPSRKEWKSITDAAGSTDPAGVCWAIKSWNQMCEELQACVQKYGLMKPGDNLARVVINEIESTRQAVKRRNNL